VSFGFDADSFAMSFARIAVGWVAAFLAALPLVAPAQDSAKIVRIGRLSPLSQEASAPSNEAFRLGMRDLGWVEGKNYTIESLFAQGKLDRLPALAAELVQRRVDLIVTGSSPGALAVKNATRSIPVVLVTSGDPVADGLVQSLARPGGNLTGVTTLARGLNAKRVQLLKESVSGMTRLAVLTNPGDFNAAAFAKESEEIARVLGLQIQLLEASGPSLFEQAFAAAAGERAQALSVLPGIVLLTHRQAIVELAASRRLPAIYPERGYVEAGGLMYYGASLVDMWRHVAAHADKILKGAKPADLPVEQPTKFEFIINLKTAKQLGLKIPQSVLLRADQLIE
jgi:putative tryptophan/tyrosine transport system substrate-binding protein